MKPYNLLRTLIFIAPALSVLLTFCGCHKKNTKPDPELQQIFAKGCTCVGNKVYFSFSAIHNTDKAAITWDFGDGTTSSNDDHVYNASGTYTVTLFVDGYSIAQNFYISPTVP